MVIKKKLFYLLFLFVFLLSECLWAEISKTLAWVGEDANNTTITDADSICVALKDLGTSTALTNDLFVFGDDLSVFQTIWAASWITHPEDNSEANTWLCFRKTIELTTAPSEAIAKIAVDSKYWLWINGEMVVFEGQLKRGPNPNDTYYDEVAIHQFLNEGENTIAVLVWHFGKDGFSHKNSGMAGLVFDCPTADQNILSDASWRVMKHPAYGTTGNPQPNWRLPESNIQFDARLDITDWTSVKYNDSAWSEASVVGVPPIAPWNTLVKRPIPLFKDFGLQNYNEVEINGDRHIASLPYNAQISPYLKVNAPAGKVIQIFTDQYNTIYDVILRAEYITKNVYGC